MDNGNGDVYYVYRHSVIAFNVSLVHLLIDTYPCISRNDL